MRNRLLVAALCTLPMFIACADPDEGPTPFDDEFPVSEGNVNEGAPANDSLPDDNKADAQYPEKFELADQSPVKSQGSRGVCSIFSATAQVENLYIKAGMPVEQADFSEQYLQWSAKNLGGSFRNTEGSSSDANLKAVVRFGTVKEAAWPYESAPWNASNDAECTGGENRPTKCYTNGEPPASLEQAPKFKLPSSRWVNTNSIKAHMTAKKTGVNVGLTFFYQSWNHRSSTLPVNNDLWRKGIVTYPNGDDQTASLEHRAGHAIHLIGWDDTLTAPMRDKEGTILKDADGNDRVEKGFWLFKNSWGTASFGVEHPTGPGYGWISYRYVQEYGSAVVAELPTLETPAEVCDDEGEVDEDGDGKANCEDVQCAAHPSCSDDNTAHNYSASPNTAIPDNNTTGISNAIEVTDTGALTDVKVTVDIAHPYRGDVKVTLSKGTFSAILIDRQGGAADNIQQTFSVAGLAGQDLAGAWTLTVVDTARADVGTLTSWSIEATTN